jgi:hypothetical protein
MNSSVPNAYIQSCRELKIPASLCDVADPSQHGQKTATLLPDLFFFMPKLLQ